jgi:hypothetical protein
MPAFKGKVFNAYTAVTVLAGSQETVNLTRPRETGRMAHALQQWHMR